MAAHGGILDAADQRPHLPLQPRPTFRRGPFARRPLAVPQHIDQRLGCRQRRLHRRRALLADEIVRVEPVGQKSEVDAGARLQVRQHRIDGAVGRLASGAVAVEAQRRLRHHAPQQLDLILGQRGAERGDRLAEARLRQRHHVHVALDRDDAALVVRGLASTRRIEQDVALVEQRRLGRVQVLRRLVGIERTATEGDGAALEVGDREHHAVAEAVVGDGNVVTADQHAGLDHLLDRVARLGQMLAQRRLGIGRVTDAELLDRLALEPAFFGDVGARLGGGGRRELGDEEGGGDLHQLEQPLALVVALRVARVGRRQCDAGLLRQPLDGLGERQSLGLHQEREDVAVLTAREAVVEALVVVDEERRRFLRLERRQAGIFAALALQRNLARHDLAHREPGANLVEELRIEAHGRVGSCRFAKGAAAPWTPLGGSFPRTPSFF